MYSYIHSQYVLCQQMSCMPDTQSALHQHMSCVCVCVLQFDWGEGGINTVRALYFSTASQLGLTASSFAGRVPSLLVSPGLDALAAAVYAVRHLGCRVRMIVVCRYMA
jgi:hypothetical protein